MHWYHWTRNEKPSGEPEWANSRNLLISAGPTSRRRKGTDVWHEPAEQIFAAAVYDPGIYGNDTEPRWKSAEGCRAWIRQCLTMAPGSGIVGVLMPAPAADSGPARTLRRVLLRDGVLRAIVAGFGDRHLWLLKEPGDERPHHVLLIDAVGDPALVASAWRAFRSDPTHPDAARFAVRAVDRLDERIDLTPVAAVTVESGTYAVLRAEYLAVPAETPPLLESHEQVHGVVTLGELAEAGMVGFQQSPPTVATGAGVTPMLTAKDVRLARSPSRYGNAEVAGAVLIRAGDIAVARAERAVEVCAAAGTLLGPGIDLVRVDTQALDPHFLAGVLRAALDGATSGDIDLYQVGVPRLPAAEQRRYATVFIQLRRLEAGWHKRRAELEQLVRLGYQGLATGLLRPAGPGE